MKQVLTGRNSHNKFVKLIAALVLSAAYFGAHAEKTVEYDNARYTITSEELGCYFIESTEYRSCVIELISKKKGNVFFIPSTEMMMNADAKLPVHPRLFMWDGNVNTNRAYDWYLPNLNYYLCKYIKAESSFKVYALFPAEFTIKYFVSRFRWTFGLKGMEDHYEYKEYGYKGDSIVISYMKADNGPVGEEYY